MSIGTIFTLFIVPSLYVLIARTHTKARKKSRLARPSRNCHGNPSWCLSSPTPEKQGWFVAGALTSARLKCGRQPDQPGSTPLATNRRSSKIVRALDSSATEVTNQIHSLPSLRFRCTSAGRAYQSPVPEFARPAGLLSESRDSARRPRATARAASPDRSLACSTRRAPLPSADRRPT